MKNLISIFHSSPICQHRGQYTTIDLGACVRNAITKLRMLLAQNYSIKNTASIRKKSRTLLGQRFPQVFFPLIAFCARNFVSHLIAANTPPFVSLTITLSLSLPQQAWLCVSRVTWWGVRALVLLRRRSYE